MTDTLSLQESRILRLVQLGIALSAERDRDRLLEMILLSAKEMANADGGSLYLRDEDNDCLRFVIMRNDSLDIALGGTTGQPVTYPPLPLHDEDYAPNYSNVATYAALKGQTVNIADAYDIADFDFSGTRLFDARTGYRSASFLTVPMRNYQGEVSGVLQLINARDAAGTTVPFPKHDDPLIEALASQAAVAIENHSLIGGQKALLEAFIQVIAKAIDAKSPYTGGHCERVPVLAEALMREVCNSQEAPFAAFTLSDEGWYELHLAAWLHDCGKVTTPVHVMDKATKLETICDRINVVATRFEVLKRDAEIACLRAAAAGGDAAALRMECEREIAALDADLAFLRHINLGGEFMAPEKIDRLKEIAARRWTGPDGAEQPLLTADEVYNLSIARGTLNTEERKIINSHIDITIDMLSQLPFPKGMKRVVEYAGGHHEKMDGTGYPRGLRREQLSIPARAMAIADIFEALTASDRPYKSAKTLSESFKIMADMKRGQHIDPDLFDLFLKSGVWRGYADRFLAPEQIDMVDISKYL